MKGEQCHFPALPDNDLHGSLPDYCLFNCLSSHGKSMPVMMSQIAIVANTLLHHNICAAKIDNLRMAYVAQAFAKAPNYEQIIHAFFDVNAYFGYILDPLCDNDSPGTHIDTFSHMKIHKI